MVDHVFELNPYSYSGSMQSPRLAEPDWSVEYVSIPISLDSEDVLDYVTKPFEARYAVGYNRELLDEYRPGETWYLSASTRHELRNMGDTGQTGLPSGTYGRGVLTRLLVDLSWASSNLEGNTYTWLDTRELIEHGNAAEGRAWEETQMILNHKRAIEFLVEEIDTVGFNRSTVFTVHDLLSEGLINHEYQGTLRQHAIGITRSAYRPLNVPAHIAEIFDMLLDKAHRISDPFEQSFFVMVHMPYLQAFADVNKRTSRMLANLPLLRENLCPLTFVAVPKKAYFRANMGVYELSRIELLRDLYVWAYARSVQAYLTIKRDLVVPERVQLVYRELINDVVHSVVTRMDVDPLVHIRSCLSDQVDESDRASVEAVIINKLKFLNEGALYRFGLTRGHLAQWQARQQFL